MRTTAKQFRILLFSFIAITMLAYVLYRAIHIPITHDEALTLERFVLDSPLKTILYLEADANNHITNTLLSWLSTNLLGINIISLRLPNILAYIGYSTSLFFLLKKLKTNAAFVLGTVLLLVNPFILEFFSLARGYGLMAFFLIAGIYFLFKSQLICKKQLTLSIIFLGLALTSIISLFYFIIPLFILLLLTLYVRNLRIYENIFFNTKSFFKNHQLIILLIGASTLYNTYQIYRANSSSQLYFGGSTNIFEDTLMSFIEYSNYGIQSTLLENIQLILILLGFLLIIYGFTKTNSWFYRLVFTAFCTALIGMQLAYTFFDKPFLINRTGLFFVVLFFILVTFSIDKLTFDQNFFRIFKYKTILFVIFLNLFVFYSSFTLEKTLEWYQESDLHTVRRLAQEKELLDIAVVWPLNESMEFYEKSKPTGIFSPKQFNTPVENQYVYIWEDMYTQSTKDLYADFFMSRYFPGSKTILLERND